MKYGKNEIEWQTSIKGMSLSELWIIWGKEKEALKPKLNINTKSIM